VLDGKSYRSTKPVSRAAQPTTEKPGEITGRKTLKGDEKTLV
jgi:hypothetical protein